MFWVKLYDAVTIIYNMNELDSQAIVNKKKKIINKVHAYPPPPTSTHASDKLWKYHE